MLHAISMKPKVPSFKKKVKLGARDPARAPDENGELPALDRFPDGRLRGFDAIEHFVSEPWWSYPDPVWDTKQLPAWAIQQFYPELWKKMCAAGKGMI
jgi:hypothetical protein